MVKSLMSICLAIFIAVTLSVVPPASQPVMASGTTIYVPDNYPTIQAAVNAASLGDTIIVSAGTYIENVVVDKPLTLTGIDYPVIDGSGNRSTITITADEVVLQGFSVTNCGFSAEPFGGGIELSGVEKCNINDNNAYENRRNGISLVNSDGNVIENNTCNNNEDGIRLWSATPSTCSNNIIRNNECFNNIRYGIELWSYVGGTTTTQNNEMISNNCYANGYGGIYVGKSSNNVLYDNNCSYNENYGIYLDTYTGSITKDNRIIGNVVSNNNRFGIFLYGAYAQNSNNTIIRNQIANNHIYGIFLDNVHDNIIYQNDFINNTHNAYSYCSSNAWNSPEPIAYTYEGRNYTNYLGNYWSDYTGSDADEDGIGDTPYSIDSDRDNYPLIKPFENYTSTSPYFVYSVKFLCGKGSEKLSVEPANYATAINIHNFHDETVTLKKKVVITHRESDNVGIVTPYTDNLSLGPNTAIEVDCVDICSLLGSDFPPPTFIKGFVAIESSQPLNIVAVYTVRSGWWLWKKVSIDVEPILPVVSP